MNPGRSAEFDAALEDTDGARRGFAAFPFGGDDLQLAGNSAPGLDDQLTDDRDVRGGDQLTRVLGQRRARRQSQNSGDNQSVDHFDHRARDLQAYFLVRRGLSAPRDR